jgi:hypothetical protein
VVPTGLAEQMVGTEKGKRCDTQPYLHGMFSQRSRYYMIRAKISTAREMAQWLTTLAALPKEPTSIPSIHMAAQKKKKKKKSLTPGPRDSMPSSGFHRYCVHMVQMIDR